MRNGTPLAAPALTVPMSREPEATALPVPSRRITWTAAS
jgi:hypothetical protein